MNEKNFDFTLEPGKKLEKVEYSFKKPIISVIMPYYNDGEYIEQSVTCILNQTFPCFELLIIDDGSTDKSSIEKLKKIEKIDKRIKVFHKKNEGPAAARDYGANVSSDCTKYFMFMDSDDLLEKTFLECAYWTLETNKDAAWAYADSVGFEKLQYVWSKWFDPNRMKKENLLILESCIRKDAFFEVKGFELREKSVNEDWNFWLKLIEKSKYPVHMNFYAFWYRRQDKGELSSSKENHKRSMEIVNATASRIRYTNPAIQYPNFDYNYEVITEEQEGIIIPKRKKDKKINILMIIPWMVTGGADIFNLELLKRLDKNKFSVNIITTESCVNVYRQQFEQFASVYDLTTFLNPENWLSFINYIIAKENINLIFSTNSLFGYASLPYFKAKYPEIPIMDYVHMEEWYYQNGGYARLSSENESILDNTYVCNKGTERVLKNYFKRNPKEVETLYIGVDTDKFNPDNYNKQEFLEKYDLVENNKYVISYICRIASQKRPVLLLEIMKMTIERRKDVLFLIAGDGDMLPLLQDLVKINHLEEYVKFVGNIKNTVEIYKISDITINCSIKEGLALTAYESLSMGVPVISSDVGGQKELINEDVGVIVPCIQDEKEINCYNYSKEEIKNYVDAIDKVILNLDEYKRKCRKRILNRFTLNQMAENMSNVFEEISKKPNKIKIENGKGLSKNLNITKEIITSYLISDKPKLQYLSNQYVRNIYNVSSAYNKSNTSYSKSVIIGERLWKYPAWRWLTKTKAWEIAKKTYHKIKY